MIMNSKLLKVGGIVVAALWAAACHDDHHAAAPPAPPATQSLSTAQVLALAQDTSETSAPIVVNGGAVTINDTSETHGPVSVNAN
jgi:hypothetical protein